MADRLRQLDETMSWVKNVLDQAITDELELRRAGLSGRIGWPIVVGDWQVDVSPYGTPVIRPAPQPPRYSDVDPAIEPCHSCGVELVVDSVDCYSCGSQRCV